MAFTITTLVENSAGKHKSLTAEYGLSFLVRSGTDCVVFDTGQSDLFLRNAKYLRENPADDVTQVVLSHGHYDHTGGFPELLRATTRNLTLHIGSGFFTPKYGVNGPALEYNGNRFSRADIEQHGHSVQEHSEELTEILENVFVVTKFDRTQDPDWPNPGFVIPGRTGFEIDRFEDEVSLVVKTKQGLVLLVGCSHPGILNIVATVQQRFEEPIYAILGGTHLMEASGARLHKALSALSALSSRDGTLLGMSHCTGETAMGRLAELSEHYFHNHTGTSLILE